MRISFHEHFVISIKNEEENIKIQNYLFSLGFKWWNRPFPKLYLVMKYPCAIHNSMPPTNRLLWCKNSTDNHLTCADLFPNKIVQFDIL